MPRIDGAEAARHRAVEQDCPSFRRRHFENVVQYAVLQLVEILNRMHHTADFQQRVQIARQPGGRRQLRKNAVGLKVQNILRANLGSGMG